MQNLDEAKKLVDVLADAGAAFEKVAEDKGSLFSKLGHLVALSPDLLKLAGADYSAAKAEFLSLSDDDKAALVAEFKDKFQLDDKAVEAKIESGIDLGIEGEELVAKLIGFAGKAAAFAKSLHAAPIQAAVMPPAAPIDPAVAAPAASADAGA